MQKQIDSNKTLTPRQRALADVVTLILEWGEPEEETPRAEDANARKTRKPRIKKHAKEKA